MDGIACSVILITLLVVILFVCLYFGRKSVKVQKILLQIIRVVIWNFLIRYFQAAFISFNFAALTSVFSGSPSSKDFGSSAAILIVQYLITACLLRLLIVKSLETLDTVQIRKKIGNLYQNLDARDR